ncbi:MAG: hypothetical protein F6K19_40295 [Cyanothece sp. SIO1E1]|nr:hypothetical protein [Cyanothece sp. SIO1E1]
MSITVEGTIQRAGMGPGAWAIITPQGQSYELQKGTPDDLLQVGLRVKLQGHVRDDVMTFAMVGPVLEVEAFELLADES